MASRLCDDMLKIEILSRTSLKTLESMRLINKEFEKLTYDPYLLDLYKQRNDIVSGFLIEDSIKPCYKYIHKFAPSRGSNNIDLGFLPRNARILASSEKGIIVFESPRSKTYNNRLISYFVCKPATKQVLALPNPKTKYLTEKVAIVVVGSNPLHYKILRLSSHPSRSVLQKGNECYITYRCEIFDSTTMAWKLLDLLLLPYSVHLDYCSQPITTRGSIYMLLTDRNILKFDAYSEKWTTFSSPNSTLDYKFYTPRQLVKHEGRLGFACKPPNGAWEIWVLGFDESWEKICVFNEEEVSNAKEESFDDPNRSVMIYTGGFLFYKGNTVENVLSINYGSNMFLYQSDLEPTNLTGS